MLYHALKESIIFLFFPLSLCIEFLAVGAVLLLVRRRGAGTALVLAGLALLFLFTTYPLPQYMLKGLEDRYPPFKMDSIASYPGIRYVVVLSSGFCAGDVPVTSILDQSSLRRLDDATVLFLRLKKINPAARLIVTGREESPYLARHAEDLGVDAADLLSERKSTDTAEQARLVTGMTKGERFFLVTSASHMPRAMALFKKAGADPVPVPSDFMARGPEGFFQEMVPNSDNVLKAETAFYEYLGLAKEKLAGNI